VNEALKQRLETTRRALGQYDQDHLLRFADRLDDKSLERLLDQIDTFDLELIRDLSEQLVFKDVVVHLDKLTPPEVVTLPRTPEEEEARHKAHERGEEAIRAGKVAALVVAGGQGTRLGFDGPKGCYPAGPVSGKTLFRQQAEKIRSAARRYGVAIPWYVMTSETNREATVATFRENGFFGLDEDDVYFFTQGMMPAVDRRGQMLLDAPGHVFTSPNGHGGTFKALVDSGALDDMARRGVEHISYFQVDNVLIKIIDPVFVGNHVAADSEMSSKGCRKTDPFERVGNFAIREDKLRVVEYSDLPDEMARQRTGEGELLFAMGSIGIHVIDREFARRMGTGRYALPYHRADKKVPYLDAEGNLVEPGEKNAVKFEMFIFDALPRARNPIVLEVDRAEEFSPIKNADGPDSPDTARRDLTRQALRWLASAGVDVPDEKSAEEFAIEIGPLFARDAGELAEKIDANLTVHDRLLLDEEQ
jgi:UDP-N-acetylglucosamine/UDP-N-acetylgalactosamine diphosphorylase